MALVTLLALLALPAHAADDIDRNWRQQCPGAAAWSDAHADDSVAAMKQRDSARHLSEPALLKELQDRVDVDQEARRQFLANRQSLLAKDIALRTDADNHAWLSRHIGRAGMPTVDQVGEYGMHLLWLLVHHADMHPVFQQQALAQLERQHAAGGFSSADLARLTDRVRVKQHLPQPYGTQHDWGAGLLSAQPIDDVERIDENRRALDLMPLADYACMMHTLRKPDGG